jgi:hypothetical protein
MMIAAARNAVLLLALALCACASAPPKAWERGHLAQPGMAWDPDAALADQREHTYASKEAASGGATVGGGGCGCN